MTTSLTKKLFYLAALTAGITTVVVIAQAQTPNASITLKKDSNSLFIVTIKDPNGIAEFSLEPTNKFSYGGGLKGCPTTFSINNVVFAEPDDFTPKMPARVIDCQGGITEFDILPPADGNARGVITNTPPPPKPATKAASAEEPAEEKATKIEEPKTLPDTIKYPVPELGNCENETECKLYCDDAANVNECVAFAKKHNLLPPEEIAKAEKFLAIGKGPGGCDSQKSCETYCGEVSRLDECITFAEEGGFISGDQLAEAKKFQTILKSGEQFPGGCTSRNTCEVYCGSPDNADECLAFAEKTGVLDEKELAEAKKFIGLMKSGETPGRCQSKEQCETYCESEENFEQCFAFAEKNGLVSKEEAEAFKKSGGKGPGNCRGRDQCEAYCQENQEECFNWAQENGLMKPEDMEKMQQGMQQFREQFDKMPPEIAQCLKDTVGEENLNKMLAGQPVFARDMESKMRGCFEKLAQSFGSGFPGGPGGPDGFSGPGGCTSPEECQAYCTANPEACQGFAPPDNGIPGEPSGPGGGEFSGPGGCTSPEECQVYCKANPEACQGFAPPDSGMPGEPGGPGGEQPQGSFPDSETTGGQFPGGDPSGGFPGMPSETSGSQPTHDTIKSVQIEKQYRQQIDCSLFSSTPKCEYVGLPGSQNYELCKQCYPDK